MMNEFDNNLLLEIRDLLKVLTEEQRNLVEEIRVLKTEQKKIHEDIKLNNFVLNNINFRNEIVN
jgi:hypothetical protein